MLERFKLLLREMNRGIYEKNTEIKTAIENLEKEFAGNGRVLIRPSGTEPLVRVMIEGKDINVIEAKAKKIADMIEKNCK